MTTVDRFERTVAEWLHEDADHHVRDHLADVLERTATTSQRPAWSSLERWLPMDLAARRPFPDLPLGRILLFAALVLAGVALALIAAGSRPKLPPPFGLAGNGIQLVSLDGHIYAVDRLGGDQRQLIQDSSWDFAAAYSRDGSKILFLSAPASPGDATPVSLESANSDGTGIRDLTGPIVGLDGFQWSPDGTQVGLLSHDSNGQGHIQVVSSSGGTVRTLDVHMSVSDATWRPPDGSEIVFRGEGDHPAIFAVRPDGSGLRRLTHQAGVDAFDYMNPALSPDGETVSFGRYLGEATGVRLFLLDVSTGAERPLGMPSDGQSQQGPVVFSPDGRSVAYTLLEPGATYQVAVVPLDGSSAGTRLGPSLERNHGDFSVDVGFVPDGSAVVAVYRGSAKDTVWWLPVDGSRGTQLAYGSFDSVDVQRRAP